MAYLLKYKFSTQLDAAVSIRLAAAILFSIIQIDNFTYNIELEKNARRRVRRNLALVHAFVLMGCKFNLKRPTLQVPRVLDGKPLVAAVRRQSDGQQMIVAAPNPRNLKHKRVVLPNNLWRRSLMGTIRERPGLKGAAFDK